jgi:hypothetical protein
MSRQDIAKPDHTGRTLGDMTEGRSRRAAERKVYHATFGSLAWIKADAEGYLQNGML